MEHPRVTIVGAGQVGATVALLAVLEELADVVLVDVAEGMPQGKALDMMHARSVERFAPTVCGTNDYADTAGSDVVVLTAGLPRRPGMSRQDLLEANAAIVESVVRQAVAYSPDAVYLCVTNPLDVMTHLAWRASGLPSSRVLGMGGVLDSGRFAYLIAEETGAPVGDVEALVIGPHGDSMVPLPGLSTVGGRPLTEVLSPETIEGLVGRTIFGGAEVVALLKTGSASYAPAASVVRMLDVIVNDRREELPACVLLDGTYGIEGVYCGATAVLGRRGVVEVPELPLTDAEAARLREAAATVSEGIAAIGGM